MSFKKIIDQLNLVGQCRKYGLPLWECPQFLFLIMGLIIIASIISAYAISTKYIEDPYTVSFIAITLTLVLLIMASIITNSFERLAEANRMKSEFVSIVSHQLRSPLSNLKWTLDLLMSERLSLEKEKELEYLEILEVNSKRMSDLISDLLITSRIEQGKVFIKKEKVSLKTMVEQVLEENKNAPNPFNAEISFEAENNLPNVNCDPSRIKMAISNLLDNARRYSRNNNKIEIGLKKKNRNIYFEIKDQGVGIPKEDQKFIFQRFFRSSNTLRHQTEGSGLGLYIAKSIVEKTGGRMGFQSQEGKGSTFWFSLPI
jgi:signal transduction histidine kinase